MIINSILIIYVQIIYTIYLNVYLKYIQIYVWDYKVVYINSQS